MRKGQISLEFIILIGTAFLFFIICLAVLYNLTSQKQAETDYGMFSDLARSIQRELILIAEVQPGIVTLYEIPPAELNESLRSHTYSISNSNTSLTIAYESNSISLPIPTVQGSLKLGRNTLKNIGGVVYIE